MRVLITGGGSGIGRALAEMFVTIEDSSVIIIGRRLENLLDLRRICPNQIEAIQADVSSIDGREEIISVVKQKAQLTHIIHCAGIVSPVVPIQEINLNDYRQQQAINTEAPLFLTQALIPYIAHGCRVLFISSSAAENAFYGLSSYGISKIALEMVCKSFQLEFGNNPNIYFASLRPGGVETAMIAELRNSKIDIYSSNDSLSKRINNGYFQEPKTAAEFIKWVLLNTTNEEYEKTWDMSNADDKLRWINSNA